ncbi:vacuolar membrane-associated protein Iml1p [Monosporozyma unispora]|nr:vacuolar membrane-associated protein iml1 [Kazachstania unispora]
MPPATTIFTSLHSRQRKNGTKAKSWKDEAKTKIGAPINTDNINNPNIINSTVHANVITLNSGNLFVGTPDQLKVNKNVLSLDKKNGTKSTLSINTNQNDRPNIAYKGTTRNNNNNNINSNNIQIFNDSDITQQWKQKSKSYQLEIMYHESRFCNDLIILNLDQIDGIKEGDLCELKTFNTNKKSQNETSSSKKKIYFIAKDFNDELKQRFKNSKVSVMLGQLQTLLDIPARTKIWIKVKDKNMYELNTVEINVKDCSLNRGDMWIISSKLVNTCVFNNQKLIFLNSIRGNVKGIYRDGKKLGSGYIGENTKVVFRSESARLIFLIQITEEMWHFDEMGEQLFQKMINSFFPKIFKKWKEIDTHHLITIAFAVSMDLSSSSHKTLRPGEKLKNPTDNYRIVVDQVSIVHWVQIMEILCKEFVNLRKDLLNVKTDKGFTLIKGRFAPVIKSNFLEMINFATTVLIDPFKQVDLRHTTTHVMILSPGSGLYDVDYDLLNLTGRKLLSLEMTMDLICLSRAPLHVVPLFRYLDYEKQIHYCVPKWLSIFFWNDSARNNHDWRPRCQIYDLQMMGLTDNEVVKRAEVSYLKTNKHIHSIAGLIKKCDDTVFIHYDENNESTNKKIHNNLSCELKAIHENENNTNDVGLKNTNKLVWSAPTYSKPVVEEAQNLNVNGDLFSLNGDNNAGNTNTNEATRNNSTTTDYVNQARGDTSPDDKSAWLRDNNSANIDKLILNNTDNDSVALNSLRGLTKKSSMKDFTRMLFTKLTQVSRESDNVKETKLASPPPPSTYPEDNTSNVIKPNRNEGNEPPKLENHNSNTLIIKKNLDIFGSHLDDEVSNSHNENASHKGSLLTTSSSKFSNLQKPSSTAFPNTGKRSSSNGIQYLFNDTWLEIANPSVPVTGDMADNLLPVRWKDVWPKYIAKRYSKWRSFTTPAELPVTISDFPTPKDFEENFFFRNHSVTLNIDQEQYNKTIRDLLKDMIYVRLVAGFQICVGSQVEQAEKVKDKDAYLITKYTDNKKWNSIKFYLMIDSEIHRICCNQTGVIDVQRYLRKNDTDGFDQVPSHTPMVKTRYEDTYRKAKIDPVHIGRSSLNWNQIDQVLAGYGDYIIDKKWHGFRAKFVVLPADVPPNTFSLVINGKNETLTPEELRLEGLRRVISSITKSRIKTEQEKTTKTEEIQPEVTFYTGSLFDFIKEQQSSLEKSNALFSKGNKLLTRDVELTKLIHELQYGPNKLTLITRKWHWKRHQNSFVGSEMVNWLIQNFSDIHTREEAIDYGQSLMAKGIFVHVLNKHNFLDGHYFYQFTPEYEVEMDRIAKINSSGSSQGEAPNVLKRMPTNGTHETNTKTSLTLSRSTSFTSRDDQTNTTTPKPIMMLSNSLTIDVDPLNKSSKQETCTVHYDCVHNPDHCFHIRLEWLTTTPKLLDDLIGNWSRVCERFGLRLIEIPWQELCTIPATNPFHSFVEISLVIDPWEDPEFHDTVLLNKSKFYYHIHLLKKNGFMLDNRASSFLQKDDVQFDVEYSWGKPEFKYAQYIHRTGAYIAEIRENGDLFLAPNNVYITRMMQGNKNGKLHNNQKVNINPQEIMENFRALCTNYEALRNIFLEIKEDWLLHKSKKDK